MVDFVGNADDADPGCLDDAANVYYYYYYYYYYYGPAIRCVL